MNATSDPILSNEHQSLKDTLQTGSIVRRRTANCIEVWGENISDHYLITLQSDEQPGIDCILVLSLGSPFHV